MLESSVKASGHHSTSRVEGSVTLPRIAAEHKLPARSVPAAAICGGESQQGLPPITNKPGQYSSIRCMTCKDAFGSPHTKSCYNKRFCHLSNLESFEKMLVLDVQRGRRQHYCTICINGNSRLTKFLN